MILKATEFAANKHKGQFRKGNLNTPYINHPVKVAYVLEKVGVKDQVVLAAALPFDKNSNTNLIKLHTIGKDSMLLSKSK